MAKGDFYPDTEGAKRIFLDNLVGQVAGVSATVGLTVADVAAMTEARDNLRAAQQDKLAKMAAAKSAIAQAEAVDRVTERTIRAQVRRLKTHPGYTEAIGLQLGVEGVTGTRAAAGMKPDLEAVSILHGAVELKFLKNGFSGVEIECMRGTETEFKFLARDTEAPYIDTRANLTDAPETRHYRARYLHKDTPTADYSDVLVVTVPGRV